jgi:hypothetical protein
VLYERFTEEGEAPDPAAVATALGIPREDAETAYGRLAEGRVIVLSPGTARVWMAPPFSAVPTAFRVKTPRGAYWGNCIWDGLGIVSMLGGEGTVETRCADCDEPMTLGVEAGELVGGDGLAHFAVPAARWWDDIGFT